ncbi:uncharacterized protein LOC143301162 [Babylonia areolata]|uniref:uncharacterized protein LOC143301162 n=1 Tax=Babylonia areolata TaxID=304850 RepID=UPI003FD1AC2D
MRTLDTQGHPCHIPVKEETGVLGAKRKHDEHADDPMDLGHAEQEQLAPKRQCREVFPDPEGDNGVVLSHRHLQQFFTSSQPSSFLDSIPDPIRHRPLPLASTQEDGDSEIYGCMKDAIGRVPPEGFSVNLTNGTPLHHPTTNPQEEGARMSGDKGVESINWMDMDGETYCPLVADMYVATAVTDREMILVGSSTSRHQTASTQWPM